MTRPIIFRAWDKNQKGWIAERVFFSEGKAYILRGQMLVACEAEVTEFTGLLDKNGKEIYEGDILGWWGTKDNKVCWPVGWNPERNNYAAVFIEGEKDAYGGDIGGAIGFSITPKAVKGKEIIGNIYENPDLLP